MLCVRWLLLLAVVTPVATPAVAQLPAGRVVVVSRQATMPASALFGVDLVRGTVAPLGAFPSDRLPPLAVAVDDLDREVLLAVDAGGVSRLLRLGVAAGVISGERHIADVPGIVTQIVVEVGGDVVLAVDGAQGGLTRVPRYGGSPQRVLTAPHATAISDSGSLATWMVLAQAGADGPPPRDAQVASLTLPAATFSLGPTPLAGYRPRAITGVVDLPTALVRHLLAHDDGTVSMFEYGIGTTALALTPVLPPGATVAMKDGPDAFEPLVLGGAAHPYLKVFSFFGAPRQWRTLAGPIPGDPVDFDWAPAASAHVEILGTPCGATLPLQATYLNGWPTLGNARFALAVAQASARQTAVLALGSSDQRYLGLALPLSLPGGCPLAVAPEFVVTTLASAQGIAVVPLPVPADSRLSGLLLFGTWLQLHGASVATSAAFVLEVGN